MALFFDYKLQSPLSETNYLVFEWHSTFPLLAIGSYSRNSTGQVHIHFEEAGSFLFLFSILFFNLNDFKKFFFLFNLI
jgi:hypothetical protein